MRILVLGAGVIGSIYAGKLLEAGHEVVLLARGVRRADLQAPGLILLDAESEKRKVRPVSAVTDPSAEDRFDLVLVSVRAEQLTSTLPVDVPRLPRRGRLHRQVFGSDPLEEVDGHHIPIENQRSYHKGVAACA
jgi:2-dehydropantoate 2-reductase